MQDLANSYCDLTSTQIEMVL